MLGVMRDCITWSYTTLLSMPSCRTDLANQYLKPLGHASLFQSTKVSDSRFSRLKNLLVIKLVGYTELKKWRCIRLTSNLNQHKWCFKKLLTWLHNYVVVIDWLLIWHSMMSRQVMVVHHTVNWLRLTKKFKLSNLLHYTMIGHRW